MSRKIEDLRDHLFSALADLRDPSRPFDVDRSAATVAVAQAIIDSAKAENDFLKITGDVRGSGFIAPALPAPGAPRLVRGDR